MTKGVAAAWLLIVLFIANMVYLHNVGRECAPPVAHDWAAILAELDK